MRRLILGPCENAQEISLSVCLTGRNLLFLQVAISSIRKATLRTTIQRLCWRIDVQRQLLIGSQTLILPAVPGRSKKMRNKDTLDSAAVLMISVALEAITNLGSTREFLTEESLDH